MCWQILIDKLLCASCNASYIGDTTRHFSTRVREHLSSSSDKSTHVFKHLQDSEVCRSSCSSESITILDSTATKFQIKLKQAMYINWEKPVLNYILLICLSLFNFHVSYVFFFFASLFSYTFHCSFVVTV